MLLHTLRSRVLGPPALLVALLSASAGGMRAAQTREGPDPALRQQLRAYATQYLATMTSVVAHEHYVQTLSDRRARSRAVVLRSDVLMLRPSGSSEPVWFRDVYEVDGRPLRDREPRLLRLLESNAPGAIDAMRAIAAEGARFNLGRVPRTTNVPDLIFSYLAASPDHVTLSSPRMVTLAGLRVTQLRFEEVGTPTYVRGAAGRDTPGRGRIWVDPATGALVRSEVILGDTRSSVTTTVDFVPHPRVSVRVPGRMDETYRTPSEFGVGTATYTDVRVFGVATSEQIRKPPPGPQASSSTGGDHKAPPGRNVEAFTALSRPVRASRMTTTSTPSTPSTHTTSALSTTVR